MLTLAFFLTALIYSTVGFAGGSTYLALLTMAALPLALVPPLALICNIVVAAGNSIRYTCAGLLRLRLLLPHMALAIPCAYLGGSLDISKTTYQFLTAFCLSAASLHLLLRHPAPCEDTLYTPPPLPITLTAGGILGFLSGLIGIGGGIFLAPLLYLLKAGSPKEIASTCSWFILVNSVAGLAGQWHKLVSIDVLIPWWPLPLAVLLGGQIGSHLTLKILSLDQIVRITGLVLLCVTLRLWWDCLTDMIGKMN